jgi:hypothetical protein
MMLVRKVVRPTFLFLVSFLLEVLREFRRTDVTLLLLTWLLCGRGLRMDSRGRRGMSLFRR